MTVILESYTRSGQDTCYRATYTSQTRDQQRFIISEVADDWHEPMVPQRIMWPSVARANGPTVQLADTPSRSLKVVENSLNLTLILE